MERDHLLELDFDLAVVGIASQPFWLRSTDGSAGVRLVLVRRVLRGTHQHWRPAADRLTRPLG